MFFFLLPKVGAFRCRPPPADHLVESNCASPKSAAVSSKLKSFAVLYNIGLPKAEYKTFEKIPIGVLFPFESDLFDVNFCSPKAHMNRPHESYVLVLESQRLL